MSLTLSLSECQLSLCWKGAPAPGPAGVSLCSFPTNPIIPGKGGVGTVAAGRGGGGTYCSALVGHFPGCPYMGVELPGQSPMRSDFSWTEPVLYFECLLDLLAGSPAA